MKLKKKALHCDAFFVAKAKGSSETTHVVLPELNPTARKNALILSLPTPRLLFG